MLILVNSENAPVIHEDPSDRFIVSMGIFMGEEVRKSTIPLSSVRHPPPPPARGFPQRPRGPSARRAPLSSNTNVESTWIWGEISR